VLYDVVKSAPGRVWRPENIAARRAEQAMILAARSATGLYRRTLS